MGSEWRELRLKDVVGFVADNRGKNPDSYAEEGIPVIDNYLITGDWLVNLNDVRRFIDEDTCQSFIRKHIQKDDVLVTLVGNGYGQVGVTPDAPCVIIQNTIGLRCDEENDNKFLYYLLKANRPALMNLNIGAAQPSIKVGNLLDLEFSFPSLIEQRGIASVLESLDNKIALNRQINTTLESMAQALFKSWFVDFDPVIDNALAAGNEIPDELAARAARREALRQQTNKTANETSNKTPGATDAANSEQALPETGLSDQCLPSEIQQLFPDRFVLTEDMGWVPEGWEVHRADEISTISIGKTPPRKESQWFSDCEDSNFTWVSIKDMGACGVFIGESSEYLTKDAVAKHNVKMVPKGTVLLSFKLTVGRVAIAGRDLCTNEAIAHFANPKKGLNKEFLYCYLSTFDYGQLGSTSSIATAINSKIIKSMPVLVPSIGVLTSFKNLTENWFNQIDVRNSELAVLSNLRDSLLPKLLSGQVTIPDAEQQLAEVL